MKVSLKPFQRLAERETASRGLDLKPAQPEKENQRTGARCAADSPGSGWFAEGLLIGTENARMSPVARGRTCTGRPGLGLCASRHAAGGPALFLQSIALL